MGWMGTTLTSGIERVFEHAHSSSELSLTVGLAFEAEHTENLTFRNHEERLFALRVLVVSEKEVKRPKLPVAFSTTT